MALTQPPYDSELAAVQASFEPFGPITPDFVIKHHLRTDRSLADLALIATELIGDRAIEYAEHTAPGLHASDPPVALSVFTPIKAPSSSDGSLSRPCIFYIHGGAFIFLHRLVGVSQPLDWAIATGAVLISVEYRRAPEHPQPAASDDCFAALHWVRASAELLNIDRARILVAGHSAGSGLAAGLTLRARDEGLEPRIRGQMLPCPMVDDRSETLSCIQFDNQEPWDRKKNVAAWEIALGGKSGQAVSPYWAPARAESLAGLPPAFLEVGSTEPFRDEAIAYASRLWDAGVVVDLHVWAGGFHGFDEMAPESWLGRRAISLKLEWVKRILG